MAAIYTKFAEQLTAGLQSSAVCDEAIQTARLWARERGEEVVLDDAGLYTVYPDGTVEEGAEGDWDED
jgi:hypothetical protein